MQFSALQSIVAAGGGGEGGAWADYCLLCNAMRFDRSVRHHCGDEYDYT